MQNNSVIKHEASTLYEPEAPSFAHQKPSVFDHLPSNTAAVPKLNFKDKVGLVFVVAVLLMLQLLEKLKVIK